MAERDRDESGRARSARPREPLVGHFRRAVWVLHASRMTSSCPQPKPSPMPRTCWTGALAFNAHGVLEAARKNGPADRRMLWQGLAQLAVGITHVQRGATSRVRSRYFAAHRHDLPTTSTRCPTPSTPLVWSPTPRR